MSFFFPKISAKAPPKITPNIPKKSSTEFAIPPCHKPIPLSTYKVGSKPCKFTVTILLEIVTPRSITRGIPAAKSAFPSPMRIVLSLFLIAEVLGNPFIIP